VGEVNGGRRGRARKALNSERRSFGVGYWRGGSDSRHDRRPVLHDLLTSLRRGALLRTANSTRSSMTVEPVYVDTLEPVIESLQTQHEIFADLEDFQSRWHLDSSTRCPVGRQHDPG
jgi:hypothetical protein